MTDERRKAFEKWYWKGDAPSDKYEYSDHRGEYHDFNAELAWHAWQAALDSTQARVDEEALRDAYEHDSGLDWGQPGGEYAQDHYVAGWKAALSTTQPREEQ